MAGAVPGSGILAPQGEGCRGTAIALPCCPGVAERTRSTVRFFVPGPWLCHIFKRRKHKRTTRKERRMAQRKPLVIKKLTPQNINTLIVAEPVFAYFVELVQVCF